MKILSIKERAWPEIESALQDVGLWGDPSLKPYAQAKITSRIVEPNEIAPISYYVLADHLQMQADLHRLFMEQYTIDTLDLNGSRGGLRFKLEGEKEEWLMVPPIVEISKIDDNVPILVDGEHRFMLAQELGQKIRVLWVDNVDPRMPVVARPIGWDEVKIYNDVPPLLQKKDFRYTIRTNFPDLTGISKVPITDDNFRYFFYRDYSRVASTGIRK